MPLHLHWMSQSLNCVYVKCLQLTSGKSHITHVCLLGLVPSKFSATSGHAFVIFTVSFLVHSLRMGKQRASVSIPPFNGAGNTHGGLGFVRDSDSYFVFLNTWSAQVVLSPFGRFSLFPFGCPFWALLHHWWRCKRPQVGLSFLAPGLVWLSQHHNMPKPWQVIMVMSLLSKLMAMNKAQQSQFSDELENLREVVRSIMTFCGQRLESLGELWSSLTTYRCLADQVAETKTLPSQQEITLALTGNPNSGAARLAELGTFHQLGNCPFRVVLYDDMKAAMRCARSLDSSPEFEQVLLFLQDAHEFLHILIRLERSSLDAEWETMND